MPKCFQKANKYSSKAHKGARAKGKAPRASNTPNSKKRLPPNDGCDMCARLLFLCTVCVAAAGTTPVVKRRRGEAWRISPENLRSEYYAGETHTNSVLEQKGVVIDEAKAAERHKKAKAAAAASHTTFDIGDEGDMFEYDEANKKLGEGMAASHRCTIAFIFEHTYGAPPEDIYRALILRPRLWPTPLTLLSFPLAMRAVSTWARRTKCSAPLRGPSL
jgi:hypothetical protein